MRSAQRNKSSTSALILFVCLIAIIMLKGYLRYGHNSSHIDWSPAKPEPPATIIFDGEWGGDIGLHRATGREGDVFTYGFSNFYVRDGTVYIADTIKKHISAFRNSKLTRMYDYPTEILHDAGLAATDGFIYMLDDRGFITKINMSSGAYELRKHVIKNPNGLLPENAYTLYTVDRLLVINDDRYANTCLSSDDLSEVTCPFANVTDPGQRKKFIYLPRNYYASISDDTVFLHDPNGRKIGRVAGINEQDVQYDILRNYQVELAGVYYLKRSSKGATIYFRPWRR